MRHKILLLDELGERWGESHTFYNLRTPADAIRLLCINYPDFGKYLATSHEQGIAYQVTQVGHELKSNELTLPLGQHDLVITPVIIGSESAVRAIAGAALIATAVITGGAGGFFATFSAGGLTGAAATIGASLVLSGVQEMLAPQMPTYDASFDVGRTGFNGGPAALERGADGQQSYAYRGASNTVGIGKTIPIVYGKALLGSHLITTDVDVTNESDPLMTSFEKPSSSTVRVNGEKVLFSDSIKSYDNLRAARINPTKSVTSFPPPNANRVGALGTIGEGNFDFVLGKSGGATKVGFVNLEGDGEQKILDNLGISDDSGNNQFRNKCQIMITFSGLQDRVGTASSTIIQGYINFAIIIKTGSTTVLNQQFIIQGTQNFTQKIRYIFNVRPVVVSGASSYKMFVQILDKATFKTATSTTVKNATKMRIDSAGYNLIPT